MQLTEIFKRLGYQNSPNFLRAGTAGFKSAVDYGHIFRRAAKEPCSLQGVYVLREAPQEQSTSIVPVVYVCDALSEVDRRRLS